MRDDLAKVLVQDFPKLYADFEQPTRKTPFSCWGFECSDGWAPLLRRLSEKLEMRIIAGDTNCRVIQVKEKFGTLRFYMSYFLDDEMQKLVHAAEFESASTCEICGEKGSLRTGNYLTTACNEHAVEGIP